VSYLVPAGAFPVTSCAGRGTLILPSTFVCRQGHIYPVQSIFRVPAEHVHSAAAHFLSMSDKAPSFALLDEINYHEWAFFMEAILVRKDLFGIVDGSVTQPPGNPNFKAVKLFLSKQKLARAEIILRVSPSQLPHVRDPNPKVIWDNLRSLHQSLFPPPIPRLCIPPFPSTSFHHYEERRHAIYSILGC